MNMTKAKLLVVADDFTGGLDTGVKFASQGVATQVIVDPSGAWTDTDAEVLVAVEETRHLPPQDAYKAVYCIVSEARRAGIPNVYKKTDSALRGNIGAELEAALEASGAEMLSFLPAFPRMNRITVDGRHYIDGVPVSRSVFGKDPFNPVTEDEVKAIIKAQTETPVRCMGPDSIIAVKGICVIDAESDDDLERAGRSLKTIGKLNVSAGCAGFAAFLPKLLELKTEDPPTLPDLGDGLTVVCGSVNPITRRQLDWAEAHGFDRIRLTPEEKLEPGSAVRPDLSGKWRILDSNDTDPDNAATIAYAKEHGLELDEIRRRITDNLAERSFLLAQEDHGTMLITGGDTLIACLKRMGGLTLEPLLELFPGVVLSRFAAGGNERFIISKSGGFGDETLLTDLRKLIEDRK